MIVMLISELNPNSNSECVCTVPPRCLLYVQPYGTYTVHVHVPRGGSTAHARQIPYISPALVCTTQGQTHGANKHHSPLGYTLIANQTILHTCHYTVIVRSRIEQPHSCIYSLYTVMTYSEAARSQQRVQHKSLSQKGLHAIDTTKAAK